ncbi:16S rRNA (uracil(1498)-N(3))-methyltransferase [Acetobacter fallax]|uniref:Ribosomal RNA small subunit methyltransferase E n=1 Tax=Acetobacter fallax TaxID=1737473 RepID=A0ABX0KDB6_9PROT|nr:16S rRNA (uracil(1498)-N(3))-methyltransferase [Acetobacter fallax]NHO32475.1 16S rRNA (uracil(1498)-N(3))-methyltransferase [Acetobacter fallax]NHO36035.1 16S rRNA (uracil(1498)-N(3))-methyltransferase [Acetobacter fallax]
MSTLHTLPRLFIAPEAPERAGESARPEMIRAMSPEQARYLGTVMRRGEGDEVRLFNAHDGEWLAQITSLRRDRGNFILRERLREAAAEEGPVLAFALLKRDATDLVIRLGTELGVSRFIPLITERTVGQRVNGSRLESIATEAAEQCERLSVPNIDAPIRFMDFLGQWPEKSRLFAAVERFDERDIADKTGEKRPGLFSGAVPEDGILIGPEGGFSTAELDAALARPFVTPITLGNRVLRAETAVAAALALFDARIRNA